MKVQVKRDVALLLGLLAESTAALSALSESPAIENLPDSLPLESGEFSDEAGAALLSEIRTGAGEVYQAVTAFDRRLAEMRTVANHLRDSSMSLSSPSEKGH